MHVNRTKMVFPVDFKTLNLTPTTSSSSSIDVVVVLVIVGLAEVVVYVVGLFIVCVVLAVAFDVVVVLVIVGVSEVVVYVAGHFCSWRRCLVRLKFSLHKIKFLVGKIDGATVDDLQQERDVLQ